MKRTKVHRLALGLLATLAITVGMVAAPLASTANAESLSVNVGAVHHCTAPDADGARSAGEEIPQTTLRVADECRVA